MEAEAIRNKQLSAVPETATAATEIAQDCAFFLRECAAQLAELVEAHREANRQLLEQLELYKQDFELRKVQLELARDPARLANQVKRSLEAIMAGEAVEASGADTPSVEAMPTGGRGRNRFARHRHEPTEPAK
jgi:predicted phage gp36 major capsid-like protein